MTRQEAMRGLTSLIEVRKKYCVMQTMRDEIKVLEMAIKALEQELIIDKIKNEIDRQDTWLMTAGYNAYNVDIAFTAIKLLLTESEE